MRRSSTITEPTEKALGPDLAQIASRVVFGQFLMMQERERLEMAAVYGLGGWMQLPVRVVVFGSPK